jgi:hypothetical protein
MSKFERRVILRPEAWEALDDYCRDNELDMDETASMAIYATICEWQEEDEKEEQAPVTPHVVRMTQERIAILESIPGWKEFCEEEQAPKPTVKPHVGPYAGLKLPVSEEKKAPEVTPHVNPCAAYRR